MTSSPAPPPQSMPQFLALFAARALDRMAEAIEALTPDELHFRPAPDSNSIGWEAWHVFRTADNIVHFVFHREPPIWVRQGLNEAWQLPRIEQGTGMAPDVAHALVFPAATLLAQYGGDVRDAVIPRIAALTPDELQRITLVRPWGEISWQEAIGQTVVAHGNGHLGQVSTARALLGKSGLGF